LNKIWAIRGYRD